MNTSLWLASLRGARELSSKVSLFVVTEFDRNTFAGISSRYAPQLGIAAKLVDAEKDKLRAEIGGGYTWQNAVAVGESAEFAAGRGALLYARQLGPKASFGQTLEFLPNFKTSDDLRINSETALTAPLASGVNRASTSACSPVQVSCTSPAKPPSGVSVTVTVPAWFGATCTSAAEAASW